MNNEELTRRIERLEEIFNPDVDYVKVRDVKSPSRATSNDAGTDIFIPYYSEQLLNDLKEKNRNRDVVFDVEDTANDMTHKKTLFITIAPHERVLIPSGLKFNIKNKWSYLKVDNKSGVANTYGLIFGADIIDADYRGEAHISLINTTDKNIMISSGQKIIQLIHSVKLDTQWNEISINEFNALPETERGEGGFGHSGTR